MQAAAGARQLNRKRIMKASQPKYHGMALSRQRRQLKLQLMAALKLDRGGWLAIIHAGCA